MKNFLESIKRMLTTKPQFPRNKKAIATLSGMVLFLLYLTLADHFGWWVGPF